VPCSIAGSSAYPQSYCRRLLTLALGRRARGRWLAGFNEAWQWLADYSDEIQEMLGEDGRADAETVWNEGAVPRRLAVLCRLRAADPGRARAWPASTWKVEKAEFRAEAVSALAVGLTAADEPFLETALDDRSGAVRTAAASLLARLPDSALAGRLRARADAMLDFRRARGSDLPDAAGGGTADRIGTLLVTPPLDWDPAGERDGLEAKPPTGVGARGWWLIGGWPSSRQRTGGRALW
jgi:hypothetical protein